MKKPLYNICLASYPRSGNTFLRNILMEVFGVFSWNNYQRYMFLRDVVHHPLVKPKDRFYLNDRLVSPDEILERIPYQVIKVHGLPVDHRDFLKTKPFVICLIRDGRDAVVSEAHHRSNIVAPGSPFDQNLREAIEAAGGSHFGGWSNNVKQWLKRAHLVIRFEQLIAEPEKVIDLLYRELHLPEPDLTKIPTFESQRLGTGAFIHLEKETEYSDPFPHLFFRRGEAGAWKEEMTPEMQELFMQHHGKMLRKLGYWEEVEGVEDV